jgi:hypothetical protein
MRYNLLPLDDQFAAIMDHLDTLRDENHPKEMRPSYLRELVKQASKRDDLPRDKVCRWLGYCYGIVMARHSSLSQIFSFNEPKLVDDLSNHPVVMASLEILNHLQTIIQKNDKIVRYADNFPNTENVYAPILIEALIDYTKKDAKLIGVNALSLRLGLIQGYMVAYNYIDVDQERNFTRPLFHKAYENIGIVPPRSVSVSV